MYETFIEYYNLTINENHLPTKGDFFLYLRDRYKTVLSKLLDFLEEKKIQDKVRILCYDKTINVWYDKDGEFSRFYTDKHLQDLILSYDIVYFKYTETFLIPLEHTEKIQKDLKFLNLNTLKSITYNLEKFKQKFADFKKYF